MWIALVYFIRSNNSYFVSTNKYRVLVYRGSLRPTTKSKIDFYTLFMILYMYIAPGQKSDSSQGTKFWCQQKLLVTFKSWTTIVSNYFFFILLAFFWYKNLRNQIWPCSKICHRLKKLSSIQATNAVYGLKVICLLLSKKKVFDDLYHICHLNPFDPWPMEDSEKFGFKWPNNFREDDWKWGQDTSKTRESAYTTMSLKAHVS